MGGLGTRNTGPYKYYVFFVCFGVWLGKGVSKVFFAGLLCVAFGEKRQQGSVDVFVGVLLNC